ncbi:MAG: phosphatidate cytidylyltransferase [Pirellulaceae bacterium]|nr:phosphatidate cytidylyltransferase [Pirellulaceae bacterium]
MNWLLDTLSLSSGMLAEGPTVSVVELMSLNNATHILLGSVLALLVAVFLAGKFLKHQSEGIVNASIVISFNQRIRAWLLLSAILVAGAILGRGYTVVLFGFISFWALREFITMTPTRRGDHRALFWVFFLLTPLQYILVGLGQDFYGLYSILIPVYGSLLISARIALAGDYKRFLERTAKIQVGLLITVYSLSFAPALLDLKLYTTEMLAAPLEEQVVWNSVQGTGATFGLLFYFVLLVQIGDIFQFVWDKILGRRIIAVNINASKTWEGFFGAMITAMLVGALLSWFTPFNWWQAPCIALVTAVMGFTGSMTMSAIKRDRGVNDYGTLVQGHAGILDRLDSICFAAPVFFHITRYFFTSVL